MHESSKGGRKKNTQWSINYQKLNQTIIKEKKKERKRENALRSPEA